MATGTTTISGAGYAAVDKRIARVLARDGVGELIVRVALALPMIYHGASIAFGAFGGPGLKGFSAFTHQPLVFAVLVGYGEFLGGLGVLTGVLARLAALGTAIIMLGAILTVHLPNGFDLAKHGYEYALTLLLLSISVVVTGAGPISLVPLVRRRKPTTIENQ